MKNKQSEMENEIEKDIQELKRILEKTTDPELRKMIERSIKRKEEANVDY